MHVEFARHTQEATFHSPLEDFEEVTVETEMREDPLTGRETRIVAENFLLPEEEPDIEEFVTDDEGCFFCPGAVESQTPTYPDWMSVERGSVGEATSFPNLNPYAGHSNVVALTEDHFVPIDEFTDDHFADGLQAALQYVHEAFEHDPDAKFASVNMNFLRPAGSSVTHPHMQALVDDGGTTRQRRIAEAARAYYDDYDTVYWTDLANEERGGDRYLAELGSVTWLAPFAPKHHRQVLAIADQTRTGLPDPAGDVVADFASGLVDTLDYYASCGLNSFNVALFLEREEAALPPIMEITARSVFDEYYWSDAPFFTVFHDESVVDTPPEEYGKEARPFFQR